MQVLMVATSYPSHSKDWRGRFIQDMVDALAQNNKLHLSLWAPPGDIPDNVRCVASLEQSAWLYDLMTRGGIAHRIRTRGMGWLTDVSKLLSFLRRVYLRNRDVSVMHVNWLQNALPLWGTSTPAVVSVLGSDFGLLRIPGVTFLLRLVLQQRKCIIAPNSHWMVPELERRFGDIANIIPIPFGVDDAWFEVRRKKSLSIPRKWLVVSRITKGKIGPLFSWGKRVFGKDDELHLFGPRQEQIDIPHWIQYHGPTYPTELREYWFPDSMGLVTLSSHDEGRPQVILEAMAAGLPVLASNIPAHRDVISHKETGWLSSSAEELSEGIKWLSDQNNNTSAGLGAHKWVREQIGTWHDCAKRYMNAYQAVLQ